MGPLARYDLSAGSTFFISGRHFHTRSHGMPWHIVTRVCFIAAVTWAAALTRPFHPMLVLNAAIGAVLGSLIVLFETRLRNAEVTDLLGALIGGAIGLGLSKTIGAALFWADVPDHRVG